MNIRLKCKMRIINNVLFEINGIMNTEKIKGVSYLYFLILALYAIGLCAFGSAIFMFFIKMERFKALFIALIGILIMFGASAIY